MDNNFETVINQELILECLTQQSIWIGEADQEPSLEVLKLRELLADPNPDLSKAAFLNLACRSICVIDHLGGFENLVKLKLDNNKISKIENLSRLVNLETLDLSFNEIRKIDNLHSLAKLRDLNLFSNRIESIENLQKNTELQMLSLSNNEISELSEVEDLRLFKQLRVLNLAGNPIADLEDFKHTVYAFLTVEYLDYVRILPHQKVAAKEEKTEYLNAIHLKESKQKEKEMEKMRRNERIEVLKKANIDGVETLYDDMIKENSEYDRLTLIPEFSQMLKALVEDKFRATTERYIKSVLSNQKKKAEQDEMFKYAYHKLCKQSECDSRETLEAFREGEDSVNKLEFELMEIEMHHIEQFESMVDKYDDICDDTLRFNLKQSEEIFNDLQQDEEEFFKEFSAHVDKILDTVQNEGVEKIENLAFAGDEGKLEQMRVLLESKETTRGAFQSSHDNHVSHISKVEDLVRDREEQEKKRKVQTVTEFERNRNRMRCAEIFDLLERFRGEA